MMIVDEAHHAIGKSTWGKVIKHWKRALLLGVTATPTRLSGEGLEQLFNTMVLGPNTAELIDNGDLASYRLFAPTTIDTTGLSKRAGDFVKKELAERSDKRFITGSSIDHYKKHADGSPAIAFCISIAHANHVAEQYRDHGYRAVAIDGKMSKNWRRNIIRDFRSNRIQVLTSCDLISEGFDCPGIVTSILLRPTQSLGLYLQQVGRGLRTAPGKAEGIILDHAGNTMMHGLPDRDHEWTLKGSALPKDTGPSVKTCPKCFYVMPVHRGRCPECQHKFAGQGKARIIDEVAGELREVSPAEILAQRRASREKSNRAYRQFKAVTLADHIAEGRRRGYKNAYGWAKYVYAARRKRSIA
jgi:superfamily II DNA or RNA helicase